jgi:hypothetical protein
MNKHNSKTHTNTRKQSMKSRRYRKRIIKTTDKEISDTEYKTMYL